jgi:hypothetical protein
LSIVAATAIGCGGSGGASTASTADASGTNCGQPSGVPGEIVVEQPTACDEAVTVAQQYFASGKASRPWYCTQLPGKRSDVTQCFTGHYAPPPGREVEAQTQLAKGFEVRP